MALAPLPLVVSPVASSPLLAVRMVPLQVVTRPRSICIAAAHRPVSWAVLLHSREQGQVLGVWMGLEWAQAAKERPGNVGQSPEGEEPGPWVVFPCCHYHTAI
jgi:hypothetical protein